MATRPTRVRRHDPALIERLLASRDAAGTTLARLAGESGIPLGTLAYWSWRRRQRGASSSFAEVIVRPGPAAAETSASGQPMFELALGNGRRVTIAAGFDSGDLRRLLAVAEAATC
jgi:hypothetical protein